MGKLFEQQDMDHLVPRPSLFILMYIMTFACGREDTSSYSLYNQKLDQNFYASNPDLALAVDVSYYQRNLTADQAQCWQSFGVEHVILGHNLNFGLTAQRDAIRKQFASLKQGGIDSIDLYIFLNWGSRTEIEKQVDEALRSVNDLEVGRIWLDAEAARGSFTREQIAAQLKWAEQAACNSSNGNKCGIYTRKSWWEPNLPQGSKEFAHLPVWHAYYDGKPEMQPFPAFGGWNKAALKQYDDTRVLGGLCGVTVDYNSMDRAYLQQNEEENPQIPSSCQGPRVKSVSWRESLKVRSEPSIQGGENVVGRLYLGEPLKILSVKDGDSYQDNLSQEIRGSQWYQVSYQVGFSEMKTGWVAAAYVDAGEKDCQDPKWVQE